MADRKNIVTLGIGASPGKLMWFLTSGLETGEEVALDTSVTFQILIASDDLSLTVAEEATQAGTYYPLYTLTDELGNTLVDENGNELVISYPIESTMFVVRVAPDDLSVTVMEET